ncbi:MAG: hypothetical protein ABIA93_06865 [Candidatus Woesearchaeota archaeon]
MGDLQFREQVQVSGTRDRLASFFGEVRKELPKLLQDNREPMDGAQLIYGRALGENVTDRMLLRNNYVVIGDVTVLDPAGSDEVLFARYNANPVAKELVKGINPKSKLDDWGLEVSRDQYHAIREGAGVLVIPPSAARALREDVYANPDGIRAAFWNLASGGDQSALVAYKKMVEDTTGRIFDRNAMGFYPSGRKGLRPVWVWTVGYYYSDATVSYGLDVNLARLVGVAAEPLAPEKSGSMLVKPTLDQIMGVINNPDLNRTGMLDAVSKLYRA